MDAMILSMAAVTTDRTSGWRAREEGEAGSRPHSTSQPPTSNPVQTNEPTRPCISFACIEGAQQRQQLGRNHFVATMAQWKHIGLHGHSVGTFTGECFCAGKPKQDGMMNEAKRFELVDLRSSTNASDWMAAPLLLANGLPIFIRMPWYHCGANAVVCILVKH